MKNVYLFLIQALMALSLFFATACSKGDNGPGDPSDLRNVGEPALAGGGSDPTTVTIQIGKSYQGGIVAYIDETGQHGLIATPEDLSPGIQWYNGKYIETGATGTMVGTGKSNTAKIVQAQGQGNYAAKLCTDLVLNGYNDWVLPSLNELDILYRNRSYIGMFYNSFYWSSSENDKSSTWGQDFSNGKQAYVYSSPDFGSKSYTYRVRAIRYF